MTRVALLWHMHQPYYEDLVTREHILPWVRLHALKDYYGMAALLEEFPDVRVTFNLVPSLLVQLEAFAEGRAHDRYLDLGLKPADTLTRDETAFILQNFFHAHRGRMIDLYPRYGELLRRRGSSGPSGDLTAAARFTVEELRDLQVWQKLAWIDPFFLDRDPRVRALVAKDRQFTEDDKQVLRAIELELLNAVIPAYRARAAAGQIEISTSPFYHPILPLLCDTDIYRVTHPQSRMPRQRFVHPEDALEQLVRACDCHERLFGARPIGLWPSEGSVSDAMVPLVAQAGLQWMATDEMILANSLRVGFNRDGHGHVNLPERLYAPYRVEAGGATVTCAFRDHALSDLIGFEYAGRPADQAADDFVARLVEGGRRARGRGREEPTIFVILDGENAWEHFEGGGRPFLRALYGRLNSHPELRTVTMAEACRSTDLSLSGIFPGSWIDANFYIWIGHQDDQRAWSQLAEARDALNASAAVEPSALARAREEVFIAEGSDWFWWYGDDHSSDHDAEFDDLFRRHLRNVYRLLGKPVPEELFVSNISGALGADSQIDPTGWLTPIIDGEATSYLEWRGAGQVDCRDVAGAMHQAERRAGVMTRLSFGFDASQLYLRFDTTQPAAELLAAGHAFWVTFLHPEGRRVILARGAGGPVAQLQTRVDASAPWVPTDAPIKAGAGAILEVAVPFATLPGTEQISFFLTVHDRLGAELERHPAGRPVELGRPDASFEARNWSA